MNFTAYAENYNNEKDFDRHLLRYKSQTLLNYRPKLGDALELGCAMGLMTEILVPNSRTLDVVDASPDYIAYTQSRITEKFPQNDARFFIKLFNDYKPDRLYDTIILSGVLPALARPVSFLRRITHWLKPEGVIFITSHNAQSLHRRIGKAMGLVRNVRELSERDIKLFGHRKVYNRETLINDAKKAGLRIIASGGIYLKPFPNSQMEKLSPELIDAFYKVSSEVDAELCAELYLFVKK